MKKVKILYVHHLPEIGGATNSLLAILECLDKEKYAPEVLFLSIKGSAFPVFKQAGFKVHATDEVVTYAHAEGARIRFFSRKPWRPVTQLLKALRPSSFLDRFFSENKYDIVHINTSVMFPVAIAAKKHGLKVVWHIRETLLKNYFDPRYWIIRNTILEKSDAVIAISKDVASKISTATTDLVHVIYNYVDFSVFNRNISGIELRKTMSVDDNELLVVNLGGWVASKGADVYFNAAEILLKRGVKHQFLLVGAAPPATTIAPKRLPGRLTMQERCLSIMRKTPALERKIKIIPPTTDIAPILAAADILVWSATVPHFARPIMEAMAMGKPVVATDFPSSREVVAHGENGLLFSVGNYHEMADCIARLSDDEYLKNSIQENAFETALELFDSKNNYQKIASIYQKLMADENA